MKGFSLEFIWLPEDESINENDFESCEKRQVYVFPEFKREEVVQDEEDNQVKDEEMKSQKSIVSNNKDEEMKSQKSILSNNKDEYFEENLGEVIRNGNLGNIEDFIRDNSDLQKIIGDPTKLENIQKIIGDYIDLTNTEGRFHIEGNKITITQTIKSREEYTSKKRITSR